MKAADRFLGRLAGVTDPEVKRKRIGEEFIRVFEEVAREQVSSATFLVQGTLYPDVIESGSKTAANIKSHHNVGGLPEDMDFELVEPLRDLFKDEVRQVGSELGLPEEIVQRQPFPGPGLAVRIVGEVTAENLAKVRGADLVVREEIRRAGLERETWQAFCVLLADVQSVGVMGDGRTYENPVIVRAVTSEDAMTADWARLPAEVLDTIASRIVRRGAGREPGGLRHHVEAPGHDRVGVSQRFEPRRRRLHQPWAAGCRIAGASASTPVRRPGAPARTTPAGRPTSPGPLNLAARPPAPASPPGRLRRSPRLRRDRDRRQHLARDIGEQDQRRVREPGIERRHAPSPAPGSRTPSSPPRTGSPATTVADSTSRIWSRWAISRSGRPLPVEGRTLAIVRPTHRRGRS